MTLTPILDEQGAHPRKPMGYDASPLIEAIRDCMVERMGIMAHVRAGKTAREIAEITGLPRSEVYEIIADGPIYVGGWLMPRPSMVWPPEKIGTLRRMWLDGCTAAQIGSAIGVSRDTVLGRVYRMGLSRNGAKPPARPITPPRAARSPRAMQRLPAMSGLWNMSEDERRREITRRAARGALVARIEAGL